MTKRSPLAPRAPVSKTVLRRVREQHRTQRPPRAADAGAFSSADEGLMRRDGALTRFLALSRPA